MSNVSSFIKERADQERAKRKELEAKFKGNIPLNFFNPIFVWATIDSLRNMMSINREAFDELVKKLGDADYVIEQNLIKKIQSHGTFIAEDSSIENLTRSLYRETEQRGGFVKFIIERRI